MSLGGTQYDTPAPVPSCGSRVEQGFFPTTINPFGGYPRLTDYLSCLPMPHPCRAGLPDGSPGLTADVEVPSSDGT